MREKRLKTSMEESFQRTKLIRLLFYGSFIFIFGIANKVSARHINGTMTDLEVEQIIVKGQITNVDGKPLAGVSVRVTGTQNGTISDDKGNYSLVLKGMNDSTTLSFSSIGFEKQIVLLKGRKVVNIVLKPASGKQLDELVVIGYGTSKKSDLTGSVGSVKSEDLLAQPVDNALQGLQGRTSGLNVSLNGGAPGGMPSVVL